MVQTGYFRLKNCIIAPKWKKPKLPLGTLIIVVGTPNIPNVEPFLFWHQMRKIHFKDKRAPKYQTEAIFQSRQVLPFLSQFLKTSWPRISWPTAHRDLIFRIYVFPIFTHKSWNYGKKWLLEKSKVLHAGWVDVEWPT